MKHQTLAEAQHTVMSSVVKLHDRMNILDAVLSGAPVVTVRSILFSLGQMHLFKWNFTKTEVFELLYLARRKCTLNTYNYYHVSDMTSSTMTTFVCLKRAAT